MNTTLISNSSTTRIDLVAWARSAFIYGGAAGAACLMLAYVQVCHDAVARGDRWRADQRALVSPATVVSQLSVRAR